MIKDIFPGTRASLPQMLTAVGDVLFFSAEDNVSGRELWKSDGTPEGTIMLRDIRAGSAGSDPGNFAVLDRILYFIAADQPGNTRLWKSDGTADGTRAFAARNHRS
jgi:ELWxxDGT repeat protein